MCLFIIYLDFKLEKTRNQKTRKNSLIGFLFGFSFFILIVNLICGDKGSRTPDLLTASQTL